MSQYTPKIYLIGGATRGIGLALVDDIAAKDSNAIIYAGGRNTSGAPGLLEVAAKYRGRVLLVKYVSGDKEGNEAIAKEIKEKYGRVDTVIANAGISKYVGKIHETPIKEYEEHFRVNVIGPIILFQATRDLLKASADPRFIPVSSVAGSIEMLTQRGDIDMDAYSVSKTALNWVTTKIHYENEWLLSFPICPGPVVTDMTKEIIAGIAGSEPTAISDFESTSRSPQVAAGLLVEIITAATREKDGGQFHTVEGPDDRHPW